MKTLIVIPCFDMVHTDFFHSFTDLKKPPETSYTIIKNTMIYDARNIAAGNAVAAGFDRVMWLDSDMTFPPDALLRLSEDMDNYNLDCVSGLYFSRRMPNIKPVVYKKMWYKEDGDKIDTGAENYFDYPEGLVECEAAGFGCMLTSVDIIRKVADSFGSPFTPLSCMGEDMAFCLRVRQIGGRVHCDTRVKCGHIGAVEITETTYKAVHDEQ